MRIAGMALVGIVVMVPDGCHAPVGFNCGLGQYRKSPSSCASCPMGTFQPVDGNTGDLASCLPCNAGEYAPAAGMSQCTPCTSGSYQPLQKQAVCLSCPSGSVSKPGSTSLADSVVPLMPVLSVMQSSLPTAASVNPPFDVVSLTTHIVTAGAGPAPGIPSLASTQCPDGYDLRLVILNGSGAGGGRTNNDTGPNLVAIVVPIVAALIMIVAVVRQRRRQQQQQQPGPSPHDRERAGSHSSPKISNASNAVSVSGQLRKSASRELLFGSSQSMQQLRPNASTDSLADRADANNFQSNQRPQSLMEYPRQDEEAQQRRKMVVYYRPQQPANPVDPRRETVQLKQEEPPQLHAVIPRALSSELLADTRRETVQLHRDQPPVPYQPPTQPPPPLPPISTKPQPSSSLSSANPTLKTSKTNLFSATSSKTSLFPSSPSQPSANNVTLKTSKTNLFSATTSSSPSQPVPWDPRRDTVLLKCDQSTHGPSQPQEWDTRRDTDPLKRSHSHQILAQQSQEWDTRRDTDPLKRSHPNQKLAQPYTEWETRRDTVQLNSDDTTATHQPLSVLLSADPHRHHHRDTVQIQRRSDDHAHHHPRTPMTPPPPLPPASRKPRQD